MADKPKRASEYKSEQVELVRATCLYVATKLGDMIDDLLIIGGLVPSLIVDQVDLPEEADAHVGTMDLDIGLMATQQPSTHSEFTSQQARSPQMCSSAQSAVQPMSSKVEQECSEPSGAGNWFEPPLGAPYWQPHRRSTSRTVFRNRRPLDMRGRLRSLDENSLIR